MFIKSWPWAMLAKILGLSIILAPSAVLAHVTLEQQQTPVGTPYKIVLRVPHGCGDSATIGLIVQIPEGVIAIKPMMKPGWQIATTRGSYSKAYSYFHGAKFTEGVKEVTWSGASCLTPSTTNSYCRPSSPTSSRLDRYCIFRSCSNASRVSIAGWEFQRPASPPMSPRRASS